MFIISNLKTKTTIDPDKISAETVPSFSTRKVSKEILAANQG